MFGGPQKIQKCSRRIFLNDLNTKKPPQFSSQKYEFISKLTKIPSVKNVLKVLSKTTFPYFAGA